MGHGLTAPTMFHRRYPDPRASDIDSNGKTARTLPKHGHDLTVRALCGRRPATTSGAISGRYGLLPRTWHTLCCRGERPWASHSSLG
jgi:hypothetical protein